MNKIQKTKVRIIRWVQFFIVLACIFLALSLGCSSIAERHSEEINLDMQTARGFFILGIDAHLENQTAEYKDYFDQGTDNLYSVWELKIRRELWYNLGAITTICAVICNAVALFLIFKSNEEE
jgi:hypothetical protein